jgi:hypothetical protein
MRGRSVIEKTRQYEASTPFYQSQRIRRLAYNPDMSTSLRAMLRLTALALLAGLAACSGNPTQSEQPEAPASQRLTRAQVVAHARAYVAHRWSANEANVFHGEDQFGNRIDTPDAEGAALATGWRSSGQPNQGVSYQWGGFSSIAEFEAGVASGKWAGHLPTDGKSYFTPQAVGVDCSGLVSRVWGLSRKESTRSLPKICRRLEDWGDLLPGDVLNRAGRHTMIFVEWADSARTSAKVIEATTREGRVHESVHLCADLQRRGYQALRYPPLATR